MNKKPCPASINFVFALAISGVTLLVPSVAKAQTYWLHYGMTVGSTDSGTQNNSYDSGKVQSTNLLTVNLSGAGSVATASATPTATFGLLQITASCSVDSPTWDGNGHISRFEADIGGGPDVEFQDQLTITSTTLPMGTPVQIQIICATTGYITPGVLGTSNNGTTSSASVDLGVQSPSGYSAMTAAFGGVPATNLISMTVTNNVGTHFYFNSHIFVQGWAEDNAYPGFSGSVSTEITAQTYVNVLTPGASYVADSGTVYSAAQLPLPTLTIQAASDSAILSWPSAYMNYALEQTSDLDSSVWTDVTNVVIQVGSRDEVILPLSGANQFFRLQSQ